MSSIPLHPEYGVNPSIAVCFWCGKDKNELLLLGANSKRITGRDQAPMHAVYDLEPCDTCKAWMAKGVTMIQAEEHKVGERWQKISENAYASGVWAVVTEEAVVRLFTGDDVEAALRTRKCFVPIELWGQLGLSDARQYRNHYRHCETEWSDEWSCTCNDKCPVCGAEIEPYRSEELDETGESNGEVRSL